MQSDLHLFCRAVFLATFVILGFVSTGFAETIVENGTKVQNFNTPGYWNGKSWKSNEGAGGDVSVAGPVDADGDTTGANAEGSEDSSSEGGGEGESGEGGTSGGGAPGDSGDTGDSD